MSSRVPISQLPLPEASQCLTANLNPDPVAKNVKELVALLKTKPTVLRKSTAAHESAHFFYMTPLPIGFPYSIQPPPDGISKEDRATYVERCISLLEPLTETPSVTRDAPTGSCLKLKKYHSTNRDSHPRELLSVAPTCLNDCFPQLDIGDSMAVTAMTNPSSPLTGPANEGTPNDRQKSVRQELVDILSGEAVLMEMPDEGEGGAKGYAPWSLRYSGHQFGSWAGQLGDGRAISIREPSRHVYCVAQSLKVCVVETPQPSEVGGVYEMQLKGAGRTPFSRGADGLAVLRSSVREYLVAEGMRYPLWSSIDQLNGRLF